MFKIIAYTMGIVDFFNRIWEILTSNETLLIGLVTAISVTLANVFKSYLTSLWSLIYGKIVFTVQIDDQSELFKALDNWYYDNYSGNFRDTYAKLDVEYDSGLPEYFLRFTPLSSLAVIHHGPTRMLLKKTSDEVWTDDEKNYDHTYVLTALNSEGVKKFLKYLELIWNEKRLKGGICIIHGDSRYNTTHIYRKNFKSFDSLFFEQKEELIKHLDIFSLSEHIYQRRKIKYKTGILLTGPPGGGKSGISLAIAYYLKRNIYYVAPNSFSSDNEFQEYIMQVKPGSVILMEDVDSFFGDRDGESSGSKTALSFSSILNTIDGIFSPDDVVIIMTTNYKEELDKALTRKGRLDMVIDMQNPTGKYINEYVQHYYSVDEKIVDDSFFPDVPMVDIEFICRQTEDVHRAKSKIQNLKT
jgi:hypothetical protein